ncbi:MAG: hypothetical protein A3J83_01325 [Elusimicrobia bacterium RIFOXYA2_FULL_40_6]|nr:MAG: hypothetical protein A3J83_01325 [Elusimicrobia bacterium RIFOXYA2_FULL_40_6]
MNQLPQKMIHTKQLLMPLFWHSFFLQTTWNYERMQNIGFAFSLMPLLRRLYPLPAERIRAIKRHLEYFNTNPYMVPIILGVVAAMEHKVAAAQPERREMQEQAITTFKNNIAGPLAAIGDKFFWALWRPFSSLIGVALTIWLYDINDFRGTWLIPIVTVLAYNVLVIPFRIWGVKAGYLYRRSITRLVTLIRFDQVVDSLNYIGMGMVIFIGISYALVFTRTLLQGAEFIAIFVGAVILVKRDIAPVFIVYMVVVFSAVYHVLTGV